MTPGGLRSRHLIALKLLSEQGPQSQQGLADALSLAGPEARSLS
jgi:hypothetical protein